jgi:hypothetical protein
MYSCEKTNPFYANESTNLIPTGLPQSTWVRVCWKSYFKTGSPAYQICMAHLLRELEYLCQLYSGEWTKILQDYSNFTHQN